MFENILGQEKTLQVLKNAINSDKISQAYIFYGPPGVGKLLTALTFAKAMNCTTQSETQNRPCNVCKACVKIDKYMHPDVKLIFPIPNYDLDEQGVVKKDAEYKTYLKYIETKTNTPWKDYIFDKVCAIRIEQIRALQKDILISKYEGKKKVYIFEGFDNLTLQAYNAFLKTLEEPPIDTHFILIVNNLEKLLPTILSRCIRLAFHPISVDVLENYLLNTLHTTPLKAKLFSRLSNGSLEKAIDLYHNENLETMEITIDFLNIVIEQNDIGFLEWIDNNFVKGTKSIDIFKNFVLYLCLWIRDVQVYNEFIKQSINDDNSTEDAIGIVFINQIELLQKFQSSDVLINLLLSLDEYLIKYSGNVNPKLILSQIYQSFITTFIQTRSDDATYKII